MAHDLLYISDMETYRDKIINFDSNTLQSEAERLFLKMGGLGQEGKKYDTLRDLGDSIRTVIESRIDTKAICSYYDRDSIRKDGSTITIDGVPLTCNAFSQIDDDQIRGAFVYFIYAGDYYLEDEVIMNQLLADMWGTAFVDAIRDFFRRHLQQQAQLSDEFGPGFYGMDVRQMLDLAKLTDLTKIDMEVRESGILLPLKSCGGLYLEVEDGYIPLDTACLECRGTLTSCSYCNIKNRNQNLFCFSS